MSGVTTCSESLLRVGRCCVGECPEDAVWAVLDTEHVEHLRCEAHSTGDEILGRKVWRWAAGWGPR